MENEIRERVASSSFAYPTMGIILLGGISDRMHRYPLHTSAGIAYTGIEEKIRVETEFLVREGKQSGYLNGVELPAASDNRSPFSIINRYSELLSKKLQMGKNEKISFSSINRSIISGSSDGAAAAVGKCLEDIMPYEVSIYDIENELRVISESVGRSIYGGLTITDGRGGPVLTEKLLDESAFRDYAIVGCKFSSSRHPSDDIHENVVKSPAYRGRISDAEVKGKELRALAEDRDIKGIFDLAMKDTERYHSLIESVGVNVITPEMRAFIDEITNLRRETWVSYIVTGGTNVFVPVEKKNIREVVNLASKLKIEVVPLKVSGGASTF